MYNLEIFKKDNWKVRSLIINNEPYFVAKDVAINLGYKNTRKAIRDHCKKWGNKIELPSSCGIQETTIIPEPDLYRLIMKSQLKSAEKFQDWVCEEILPSIRKTGQYNLKEFTLKESLELNLKLLEEKLELEKNNKHLDIKYNSSYHRNAGKIGARQKQINYLKKKEKKSAYKYAMQIKQLEEEIEQLKQEDGGCNG